MIRLALLCLAVTMATVGMARACETVTHRDRAFTVCTVDLATQDISLHLLAPDGTPLGDFAALERAMDRPVTLAMNGGMYHPDRRPVGLYVEDGREVAGLVTQAGPGNFGMLPNGVFCVRDDRADVIETGTFAAERPDCRSATQSGPMLVIDGALHPRFLPASPSAKRRNGVGASADGRIVHFVVSEGVVTFHEMATLFRDVLGVANALYLDGSISRLHVPAQGRSDPGRAMGPILAVTDR
ncbi:phosphodiester glycosidase family protein [uncultured Jannaschia sp.]|uniref:phosphodiester glycosidase family protein n=1 Tax=uncultured Jannaschia sp. TaxID=293347 RepID=UPI002634D183|nr:phosphodiester glycosidase family protein [uncultured Jannaschia sp.]